MSEALTQVAIDGGDRELNTRLNETLSNSGSTVVPIGGSSPVIVITRSEYERDVRTRNANGIATGYDYTYTVDYNVVDANGETLQAPASLTQRRTLEYDPENELEAEDEEEFLREEMEKELVLQMMRRLARI